MFAGGATSDVFKLGQVRDISWAPLEGPTTLLERFLLGLSN